MDSKGCSPILQGKHHHAGREKRQVLRLCNSAAGDHLMSGEGAFLWRDGCRVEWWAMLERNPR